MTTLSAKTSKSTTPNYGIDAPSTMRNFFLFGGVCLLLAVFLPPYLHLGPVILATQSFYWPAGFLTAQGLLFLLYVKVGKFRHRDMMLNLVQWRGDEQVLDVGCGRGLLLAGAAKRLRTGHATGVDVWSNEDMGGNSPQATNHNLQLEGVADRCTILSVPAQEMMFPDSTFDLIVSNLCLHNIYASGPRREALQQIARVLKPGGTILLSDYKLTGEYAAILAGLGLSVAKRHGSFLTTFPPLTVVIATKPL